VLTGSTSVLKPIGDRRQYTTHAQTINADPLAFLKT
jgi:hypothetical protein